jgi:hypothetical protein
MGKLLGPYYNVAVEKGKRKKAVMPKGQGLAGRGENFPENLLSVLALAGSIGHIGGFEVFLEGDNTRFDRGGV